MNKKAIDRLILVLLILMIVFLNYPSIDNFLEKTFSAKQEVLVERIIDGDTIETNIGNIRLLGINTPEKKEFYYEEAKSFLESKIFNKTVQLEFTKEKKDKYNRTLAYIFYNNENINVKVVENGFANYYFYGGKDKYSNELENAWNICLKNNVNLCQFSDDKCSKCIFLVNSSYLKNSCSFFCDVANWTIKGEGRDKFVFNETTLNSNAQINFKLDISNTGGTLFLRDKLGKLVFWKIINNQ